MPLDHGAGESNDLFAHIVSDIIRHFVAAAICSGTGSKVHTSAAIPPWGAARAQAGFSAGGLPEAAGAINASNRRAVRRRVPGDIEVDGFAGIRAK